MNDVYKFNTENNEFHMKLKCKYISQPIIIWKAEERKSGAQRPLALQNFAPRLKTFVFR